MTLHDSTPFTSIEVPAEAERAVADYLPPRVERLGSLAELTLGGSGPNDDGLGGAGDEGSV